MIIRATAKLLKLSGIKAEKNLTDPGYCLPGEWYAGLLSMGRPGKMAIHYLHYPAKISLLMPGKSLNKTLPLLPERLESLLGRHGLASLYSAFIPETQPPIYTTNSRSMVSFMNQLAFAMEYSMSRASSPEAVDFDALEDSFMDWLFTKNGKAGQYEPPQEILKQFLPAQPAPTPL